MPKEEADKELLTEIEEVFAQWQRFQANPDRCLLSSAREALIKSRLKEYKVDELVAVILWAYKSQDQRAIYLRENGYGDLDNLFRKSKIDARIEAAAQWTEEVSGMGASIRTIPLPAKDHPKDPQPLGQKPPPPQPPRQPPAQPIRAVSMRRR